MFQFSVTLTLLLKFLLCHFFIQTISSTVFSQFFLSYCFGLHNSLYTLMLKPLLLQFHSACLISIKVSLMYFYFLVFHMGILGFVPSFDIVPFISWYKRIFAKNYYVIIWSIKRVSICIWSHLKKSCSFGWISKWLC